MKEVKRSFEGRLENLAEIGEFIDACARQAGLPESDCFAVQLAVDEAVTNIIEYAYGDKGVGEIELTVVQLPEKVVITLHDEGEPFDPDAVKAYRSDIPLEEMKLRGAGLHLIKNLMDDVRFEFDDQEGNTLRMVKLIP